MVDGPEVMKNNPREVLSSHDNQGRFCLGIVIHDRGFISYNLT